MKKKSYFWGIAFIAAAVLIIVGALSETFGWFELPVMKIAVGAFLVCILINELIKGKISRIFFPLAFIFMLFESEIAGLCNISETDFVSNWTVLLSALLLTIGTAILTKKFAVSVTSLKKTGGKNSFGHIEKYIDCGEFSYEAVENNFGRCDIFFENTDMFCSGAELRIENNFGYMEINVPSSWTVRSEIVHAFAVSSVNRSADSGLVLKITGENNFGNVVVSTCDE